MVSRASVFRGRSRDCYGCVIIGLFIAGSDPTRHSLEFHLVPQLEFANSTLRLQALYCGFGIRESRWYVQHQISRVKTYNESAGREMDENVSVAGVEACV
jgi:hypothetical protein